ncbi:hypothetical protein BKA82DRAFT_4346229 [Pisolithus tinctorius]|nr:hypothetical protein BKA82DRAFT_4346229 [Pisolithus tinctorius]
MDDENALWRHLEALEDENDCDEDCNCVGCLLVNPPDEEERTPPQLEQIRRKKATFMGRDLLPKVLKILNTIHGEGLSLSLFLDVLSWGD